MLFRSRPLWDRRILAIVIAAVTTAGALFLNIADYENFLLLLGSVFVPLFAVLVVDFFVLSRGYWDMSAHAAARWLMLAPWAVGFVVYQLINPGYISWLATAWARADRLIGFTPASWMSASILSFSAAAAATFAVSGLARLRGASPAQAGPAQAPPATPGQT